MKNLCFRLQFHVYKSTWLPVIGEQLKLERDVGNAMTDCEEFMFSSAVSCVQVYLVARHRRAAKARKRCG